MSYDLPEMEEDLKETYGITVYQEQVMLLSQKLADFSKGEADVLRKAMGKKQKSVLDKMKPQFIEQAEKKGHPAEVLEKIWKDWEAFARQLRVSPKRLLQELEQMANALPPLARETRASWASQFDDNQMLDRFEEAIADRCRWTLNLVTQ